MRSIATYPERLGFSEARSPSHTKPSQWRVEYTLGRFPHCKPGRRLEICPEGTRLPIPGRRWVPRFSQAKE